MEETLKEDDINRGRHQLKTTQIEVLVQACLRAPHVVADEAKLAIVFTYFFFLLLFSFFFFFFFSAFYFSPTSGNLPCVKICFPQYFDITRRYMQKKNIFFQVIFLPPRKKGHFRKIFRDGQRSVTAAWATRSPWSIVIANLHRCIYKDNKSNIY